MEAQKTRFVSNSSGTGNRLRSRAGGQPRRYSSKGLTFAEVQAQCNKLRSQNEALRSQNLALARELNEVKSKLRNSRQKERELERILIRRDESNQCTTPKNRSTLTVVDGQARTDAEQKKRGRQQSRRSYAHGSTPTRGYQEIRVDQVEQPDNSNLTEFYPSNGTPDSAQSLAGRMVEDYSIGKAADLVERQGSRRASILPNTLIDLHLGRRDEGALSPMRQMPTRSPVGSIERLLSPLVKPQTKLGTSSAPVQNSAIGDGEYLPEDYVFRMGSSDHINGEPSSIRGEAELSTKPEVSTSNVAHPNALVSVPSAASDCQAASLPSRTSTTISLSRCGTSTSELGDVRAGSGKTGTLKSSKPTHETTEASELARRSESLPPTPRPLSTRRPRRDVARPLSYQEPSLNTKMRRGHVIFPKTKSTIRVKEGPKNTEEKEKENERTKGDDAGQRRR